MTPNPLTVPWYAVVNDLVGGWAIATADLPLSAIDTRTCEVLIIAELASEDIARYVAALHNAHGLDAQRRRIGVRGVMIRPEPGDVVDGRVVLDADDEREVSR